MGNIHVKLYEIRTVVQEEMSLKERVYGRTDGRPTETNHNSSH